MKIVEIIGGWRLPLSNEETVIVEGVKTKKLTEISQLNDRARQVVLELVRKNVLNITEDNKIFFNGPKPIGE
jgi:hypothetical protein